MLLKINKPFFIQKNIGAIIHDSGNQRQLAGLNIFRSTPYSLLYIDGASMNYSCGAQNLIINRFACDDIYVSLVLLGACAINAATCRQPCMHTNIVVEDRQLLNEATTVTIGAC